MKAMLSGFAAIIVIAVVASVVLQEIGFSTQERQTGASVRLGD